MLSFSQNQNLVVKTDQSECQKYAHLFPVLFVCVLIFLKALYYWMHYFRLQKIFILKRCIYTSRIFANYQYSAHLVQIFHLEFAQFAVGSVPRVFWNLFVLEDLPLVLLMGRILRQIARPFLQLASLLLLYSAVEHHSH